MPNRETASARTRATALDDGRQAVSRTTGPPTSSEGRACSVKFSESKHEVGRAIKDWLLEGQSDGWSRKPLYDRLRWMDHLCWWLENEAGGGLSLDEITPSLIRSFLIYAAEPNSEG